MDKCCQISALDITEDVLIEYAGCGSYEVTCTECDKVWDIPITLELDTVYASLVQVSPEIENPSEIKAGDFLITKQESLDYVGLEKVEVYEVDHKDKGDGAYPLITYKGRDGRLETRTYKFFSVHVPNPK